MDKRTVVLGVTAIAAVAAAVIVTVAKTPGPSSEHKATARYIEQVDAIQQHLRVELTKATQAYRDFAHGNTNTSGVANLARAERTMQTLERNLQAVSAPAVAARLKKLLTTLAIAEVALAHEVRQLAAFSPRFTLLIRAANDAGKQLGRSLAAVSPPTAHTIHGTKKQVAKARAVFKTEAAKAAATQADAVDAYDAKIAIVWAKLRKLRPPDVMGPAYRTQLVTLARTRKVGSELAGALRKPDRSGGAVVGRRFSIAARGATTVAAQQAQISAVKAYNRRVRAIGSLQASIQSELVHVQTATD
jgi:hypothetical protein